MGLSNKSRQKIIMDLNDEKANEETFQNFSEEWS